MSARRNALGAVVLFGATVLFAAGGAARETTEVPVLDTYRVDDRRMAEEILANAVFETDRRTGVRADAAVFDFVVDHPDFAAAVNRGLGLGEFQVRQEGQRYEVTHGHARGTFWMAERRPDRVAYLATGTYEHPVLRAMGIRLRARSFIVSTVERDSPHTPMSTMRVHVHAYLQIENSVLGPVLRRFGPLVRGAFESKLTAGQRIGPELAEMAFRDRERLLERLRRIEGLAPLQLARFEELVRAQPDYDGGRTVVAPALQRSSRATP